MADAAPAAYVTGCDAPLLVPAFVRRVAKLLGDAEAAVPRIDGFYHPLAAVYRTSLVAHIEALLGAGRQRAVDLCESVRTRDVSAADLADVDPSLQTLRNVNRREDYLAALADAGLAPPKDNA